MNNKLLITLICLCLLIVVADLSFADEQRYKGKKPPSLEIIQDNLLRHGNPKRIADMEVIGLHKERDGAYLVITNKSSNSWGGPFQLLRLESNEWLMTKAGTLYKQFDFITEFILSKKDRQGILNAHQSFLDFLNGSHEKETVNKFVNFFDAKDATDTDIEYFVEQFKTIKSSKLVNIILIGVNAAKVTLEFIVEGEIKRDTSTVVRINGNWYLFSSNHH